MRGERCPNRLGLRRFTAQRGGFFANLEPGPVLECSRRLFVPPPLRRSPRPPTRRGSVRSRGRGNARWREKWHERARRGCRLDLRAIPSSKKSHLILRAFLARSRGGPRRRRRRRRRRRLRERSPSTIPTSTSRKSEAWRRRRTRTRRRRRGRRIHSSGRNSFLKRKRARLRLPFDGQKKNNVFDVWILQPRGGLGGGGGGGEREVAEQ